MKFMTKYKPVANRHIKKLPLITMSMMLGLTASFIPAGIPSYADDVAGADNVIISDEPAPAVEGTGEVTEISECPVIVVGEEGRVDDADSANAVMSGVIPSDLDASLQVYSEIGKQEGIEELHEEMEKAKEPTLEERYFYALYDTGGKRNDINEHTLQVLVDACNQYNVSPDLMLGIIMTESEGHANAKSKSSTATGFCQILRGTGRSIYEDLMRNPKGSYSHDMAYNPDLNIVMGVVYVAHLKANYNGNTYKAIQCYRGKSNVSGYIANINKYTRQVGLEALDL